MILVDTSVWIGHFRQSDSALSARLNNREVLAHPLVIGEIAMGLLPQRGAVLNNLQQLPAAVVATDDEVLAYIERNRLFGLGVGYIDAHLLAATALTVDAFLWTRDLRLRGVAERLGLASKES
jgi:predicted nucleic acid-binding protein